MLFTIVAPTDCHLLEIAGITDALDEANRALESHRRYGYRIVAETAGPQACGSGVRIAPDAVLADFGDQADTLLVAGAAGRPAAPAAQSCDWLVAQAAGARRYGAVGTGAFWLGSAGLLDGHRVTTRWPFAAILQRDYPRAHVEAEHILLRDGPLFTSAGASAAIDLTLFLIEQDHGRSLALGVARRLLMALRRAGSQLQYHAHLTAYARPGSAVEPVQRWIGGNPEKNLSLPELARRAGMSQRNFTRVFRQESGMSVADYVELSRIDLARRMLEESSLPLPRIARMSGFSGADLMRRTFLRRLGIRPADYRANFGNARVEDGE